MRSVKAILADLSGWRDVEVVASGTAGGAGDERALENYKDVIFNLFSSQCNCSSNFVLKVLRVEDGAFVKAKLNILRFVSEMPDMFDYCPEKLPAMTSKQELRALLLKNVAHLQYDNGNAIYTGSRDAESAIVQLNHLCAVLTERTGVTFDHARFVVQTMVYNVKPDFEVDIDALHAAMPHRVTLERAGNKPFPSARVMFGVVDADDEAKKKRAPPKAIIASTGNSIVTGVATLERAKEVVFLTYMLCVLFKKGSELKRDGLAAVQKRMESL